MIRFRANLYSLNQSVDFHLLLWWTLNDQSFFSFLKYKHDEVDSINGMIITEIDILENALIQLEQNLSLFYPMKIMDYIEKQSINESIESHRCVKNVYSNAI